MPVFEYKCRKCGHIMEFLEKSGNRRKHICERCKSADMQKLLSGFAVGHSGSTSTSGDSCPTGTCPLS
jgi:putative FmdB family regulatory protein